MQSEKLLGFLGCSLGTVISNQAEGEQPLARFIYNWTPRAGTGSWGGRLRQMAAPTSFPEFSAATLLDWARCCRICELFYNLLNMDLHNFQDYTSQSCSSRKVGKESRNSASYSKQGAGTFVKLTIIYVLQISHAKKIHLWKWKWCQCHIVPHQCPPLEPLPLY